MQNCFGVSAWFIVKKGKQMSPFYYPLCDSFHIQRCKLCTSPLQHEDVQLLMFSKSLCPLLCRNVSLEIDSLLHWNHALHRHRLSTTTPRSPPICLWSFRSCLLISRTTHMLLLLGMQGIVFISSLGLRTCFVNCGVAKQGMLVVGKSITHTILASLFSLNQSEITKDRQDVWPCRKMSCDWLIVSGPLPVLCNDEKHSRLTSLNHSLPHYCSEQVLVLLITDLRSEDTLNQLKVDGLFYLEL